MNRRKAMILYAILSFLCRSNSVLAAEPPREPIYTPLADPTIRMKLMEFLSPHERQDLAQVDRSFRRAHLEIQKSLTFRPHDLPADLNGVLDRFPRVTALNFHGIEFNKTEMSTIVNAVKPGNKITHLRFYGCLGLEDLHIDTVFSSLTEIGSTSPFQKAKLPQGLSLTKLDWSENFKLLVDDFTKKHNMPKYTGIEITFAGIHPNRLGKLIEHAELLITEKEDPLRIITALAKVPSEVGQQDRLSRMKGVTVKW